jgi:hypothetical protein
MLLRYYPIQLADGLAIYCWIGLTKVMGNMMEQYRYTENKYMEYCRAMYRMDLNTSD